jgi:hypothetical protein
MNDKAKALYDLNIDDFGDIEAGNLMGLTIYGEARGESRAGRIAVGTVILERAEHRGWDGKTIEEVCLWPYQFSCYLPSDPNRATLKRIADDWQYHVAMDRELFTCAALARGLMNHLIPPDPDIVAAHCCQYLTPAAKNAVDWWKSMKFVKRVGGHEFYA